MTLRSSSSLNLVLLKFIESKISTNWILFGIQCGYFCGLFSCLHLSMVYSIPPPTQRIILVPDFYTRLEGYFWQASFRFCPLNHEIFFSLRKSVTSFRHQKELHICGFYSHLKQFFRDHCLLQKPNQHSNNTADERFSPLEFSIDKY
jgi:hypothetical protein